MLRDKMIVCSILFLSILALGALLHFDVERERAHHMMRLPVPDGIYRVYNSFETQSYNKASRPYRSREYLKIVEIESGH